MRQQLPSPAALLEAEGLRILAGARGGPAAESARVDGRRRFPALALLFAAGWSAHLGEDASVFLQAHGDRIFLRLQDAGRVPPALRAEAAVASPTPGRATVRLEGALVPADGGRVFALDYLNGGGSGALFEWPAARGADLLRRDGQVALSAGARPLGSISLTPPSGARSGGPLDPLLAAYAAGRSDAFRSALGALVRYRGGWRRLSLMQNLWLSAIVAEILRREPRAAAEFGCDRLAGHPQLLSERGAA
jgi:hypothetical protein